MFYQEVCHSKVIAIFKVFAELIGSDCMFAREIFFKLAQNLCFRMSYKINSPDTQFFIFKFICFSFLGNEYEIYMIQNENRIIANRD